jgi:hypothetical protein
MADLSWAPCDCAFERVGPSPAKLAGWRSATFLPSAFGALSRTSADGSGEVLALDLDFGQGVLASADNDYGAFIAKLGP